MTVIVANSLQPLHGMPFLLLDTEKCFSRTKGLSPDQIKRSQHFTTKSFTSLLHNTYKPFVSIERFAMMGKTGQPFAIVSILISAVAQHKPQRPFSHLCTATLFTLQQQIVFSEYWTFHVLQLAVRLRTAAKHRIG